MTTNQTIETMLNRRSARKYDERQVEDEKLEAVLLAGQRAPYVAEDSRHFTVVRNPEALRDLKTAAKEWALSSEYPHLNALAADPGFDGTYGAPTVILISGAVQTVQFEMVCAASAQNMLVAAQSLGVASCWVYFPIFAFESERAESLRQTLKIPDGFAPRAAVLLGYGAEPPAAADDRYINDITYI